MKLVLAVPEYPCTVSITADPDNDRLAIRLVGTVEMGAEAALDEAIDRVRELTPGHVVIDLGGVTFAAALLAHFLVDVHTAAPSAAIHLHHAKPTVRLIVTATRVDELVAFDDHEIGPSHMRPNGQPSQDHLAGRQPGSPAAEYERVDNADAVGMGAEDAVWDQPEQDSPSDAVNAEAVLLRLGALARSFQDLDDIEATVRAIVAAAVDTVPGATYAGLSPAEKRAVTPIIVTDQVVTHIHQAQHDTGESPAMTSLQQRRTVRVDALATDPRWPHFAARVTRLGVSSILAVHLSARREELGVLTLYSRDAYAFDDAAVRIAQLFTAHAAVAMAAARNVQHLTTALSSRDAIGQAKGILMERHRLTADQAFTVLTRASQNTNTKLADVAQLLIATGRLPGTAPDTPTASGKAVTSPVVQRR